MKKLGICIVLSWLNGAFLSAQYLDATQFQQQYERIMSLDSVLTWMDEVISEVNYSHLYEETYEAAYDVLARAQQMNEPTFIARAHVNLALWHFASSEKVDSFYYHDSLALTYIRQTSDTAQIAKFSAYASGDLVQRGDYKEAEVLLFEAIRLYEQLDDKIGLAGSFADLCFLHRTMENYEKSIEYGERSIDLFSQQSDSTYLVEPLLYITQSYVKAGDYERAFDRVELGIRMAYLAGNGQPYIGVAKMIGTRGMIYEAQKEYERALVDYIAAWEMAKSLMEDESDADGYKEDIGNVLRLQGKYDAAIPYLEDFIALFEKINRTTEGFVPDYYLYLAECYEKTNQPELAIRMYQKAYTTKIELLEKENEALDAELQIEYETRKKEEQIAAQATVIQQQRRTQLLSIGIVALLTLLLVGGYFVYRRNQRINAQLSHLNASLTSKNEQNELLLKEIHHRVKNNLQVLSSLLYLQSRHITDENALDAIRTGQNRVNSMGLIHQKLYMGEHLAAVDIQDYVQNLTADLLDAFGMENQSIQIHQTVEPLKLDIDTAIPLGLIINELLTNAMKYAFPKNRSGQINISLSNIDDRLQLIVQDDGVGKTTSTTKGTSFGTQLIKMLSEKLGGNVQELALTNGYGTRIEFQEYRLVA